MLLDLQAIFDPDRRAWARATASRADSLRCPACGRAHAITSPAELPSEWFVVWDERAAIMEYDGGLPRERAEHLALLEITARMAGGEGSSPANAASTISRV